MLPSVGKFYRCSYIKDGEMKKFCWITWMGSNCHTLCPYKRQAKEDQTDRSREKCGDKTDTETGMMWLQGRETGTPQKLQETKNRFSLLCYCLLFAYPLCPNQFNHLTAIFQILHLLISSTFPSFFISFLAMLSTLLWSTDQIFSYQF